MNRITQEQKDKILKLKKEGKTDSEISKELGIPKSKVNYWANEKVRLNHIKSARKYFLKKNKKQKSEYYKSRRNYIREYNGKRYKEDPIFRDKQRERARKYKRKVKEMQE